MTTDEYIERLHQKLEQCKYDIRMHPKDIETLEMVFDENAARVVKIVTDRAMAHLSQLVNLRYNAAVSGAMRWESSQEAPIALDQSTNQYRYY